MTKRYFYKIKGGYKKLCAKCKKNFTVSRKLCSECSNKKEGDNCGEEKKS